jgi:hypothetical protein
LLATLQEARHRQDCTHVDKIVRMFFFRAQEIYLRNSKAEGVHRIISIQINVNKYALGRPGNPGSFKIPYDEKGETISYIKMDGTVSPLLLEAIYNGMFDRFLDIIQTFQMQKRIHGRQSSMFCMKFLKHYHRGKILLTQRLMNFRLKLILSVSSGLNLQDVMEFLITST